MLYPKRRAREPSARPGRRRRRRAKPGNQRPKRVRPPGTVVLQVDPQSAAERAGLKPGDLVTELRMGHRVRDAADLQLRLALLRIGEVADTLDSAGNAWSCGPFGAAGPAAPAQKARRAAGRRPSGAPAGSICAALREAPQARDPRGGRF
jgi:hypothetical protein